MNRLNLSQKESQTQERCTLTHCVAFNSHWRQEISYQSNVFMLLHSLSRDTTTYQCAVVAFVHDSYCM